ncbi:MAG: hypothetical protein JO328_19895 [Hyphomicrobiales bacterium]|nr:hypothetical protein [Hyphomicrobiales bacterium]MBV9428795.1 hypothetical protein [Bradyrhizobiaceae bacterium]
MTTAAEEFRLHAEECLQQAKHAARPDTQETLLSMAEHWNELAICMDDFAESLVGGRSGYTIRTSVTQARSGTPRH